MHALAKASLGLVAAALLLAVPAGPVASESPPMTAPSPAMSFGMDAGSIAAQTAAGTKPDYGTFWLGPWTLTSGWGGPDAQLTTMYNQGVTPAIHLYYWGDDISKSCLENGCYSSLHKAQKDKAGWQKLTDQMVEHLNAKMKGKPVVIFLESEFNKGDVGTYEPLDGYLTEKAQQIHEGYPNAKVVMSLGNWNSAAWGTWDRTAAASDYVGIQGMRGSTRQSATDYATLYEGVLSGSKTLQAKFGKPVFLQDIALSTYPEPDYLKRQADELGQFFRQMDDLQAAGVQAIVYRSWRDSPTMDTANWYGEAERHWGLTWASNSTQKAAAKVWVDGVKAERAGGTPPPTSSSAPTTSAPTPTPPPDQPPTAAFTATASGLGASVDGRASKDPEGQPLTYAWSFGDGGSATGATASHAYASAGTYTVKLTVSDGKASASTTATVTVAKAYQATFTTGSGANAYWVEVKVGASPAPAKVDIKVGDGAWKPLRLRSTTSGSTTWGESIAVAKGAAVQFRATAPDGQAAISPSMAWLTTTSSTSTAAPAPTSAAATTTTTTSAPTTSAPTTSSTPFTASFSPKAVGNDWWIEAAVSGNQPVAKVEAKVGSTAGWTTLAKSDWGTYAKSVHAPNGTYVQFRATASSGATSTSPTFVWG